MTSIYFRNTWERGFGTYPLKGEALTTALHQAVDIGYRAIDTAQMYGNEADVGRALKTLGIADESLCITTKVHPDHFTSEQFMPSVEQSLKDLQRDVIDVLLLHWPPMGGDIEPALHLLAEARQRGLTRHIGVSNYTVAMMERARVLLGDEPLACNQVEFHPLLDQRRLLAASARTGIPLSSYCSVARGEIFKHPLFTALADDYGRTPAQIALHWILQKGVAINTMSTKPANIRANFEITDFTLSTPDLASIDALMSTGYRIVTQAVARWAPEWD
ncbi:MAG TPA: aldo/keto reductase [Thiolinea sp.]|nr:aldo/keto reductase [Thiolinea sp.]